MPDLDLDTAMPEVLRVFYARVRQDDLLGPIFNAAVHDWDDHLDRIGDFWSSVMLGTGRYKGNPVAKHLPHAARIDRIAFDRWLGLWGETTNDLLPPAAAEALQAKAARIAESLQLAIQFPTPAQLALMRKRDGAER
jgi:hemoglobin